MKKIKVTFEKIIPSDSNVPEIAKVYALGCVGKEWFVTWGARDELSDEILPADAGAADCRSGVKWFSDKKVAEKFLRRGVRDLYLPLMEAAGYKEERECFFRRFVKPEHYPVLEPEVEELIYEAQSLQETPATVNAIDVCNESAVYGFGTLEGGVGPWIAEGNFGESLILAMFLAEKIKGVRRQIGELKSRWPAHSVQPQFIEELEDLEEQLEDLMGEKELQIIKEMENKENIQKEKK